MKNYLVFIAVMLCMAACSDKDKGDEDDLLKLCNEKVVVVETANIDCGTPVVRFRDTSVIRTLTGHPNWELCNVIGLPANFNVIGTELTVCARALKPEENFACTDQGPSYPVVKILSARKE